MEDPEKTAAGELKRGSVTDSDGSVKRLASQERSPSLTTLSDLAVNDGTNPTLPIVRAEPGTGTRVLCLDGGGIRGIMQIMTLLHLEAVRN